MAELWDAYDKKFNKIENTTLVRGETIPDGIYHLVSEVIVKHKMNKTPANLDLYRIIQDMNPYE